MPQPQNIPMPSGGSTIVNVDRTVDQIWWRFFLYLWQKVTQAAGPLTPLAMTPSPFVYTTTTPGNLLITGGTVSSVTLKRGDASVLITGGLVPMALNDQVVVVYSVAPTVDFIPS